MSTYFQATLVAHPTATFSGIAALMHSVSPRVNAPADLIAYIASLPSADGHFFFASLADEGGFELPLRAPGSPAPPESPDRIVARTLSQALDTRALWLSYSDQTNVSQFTLFERGAAIAQELGPVEPPLDIPDRIANAVALAFPDLGALDPYQLSEAFYEGEAEQESYLLSRRGALLATPELYAPVSERPSSRFHLPPRLNHILDIGCRNIVLVWAALLVGGLLAVLIWWLWVTTRRGA